MSVKLPNAEVIENYRRALEKEERRKIERENAQLNNTPVIIKAVEVDTKSVSDAVDSSTDLDDLSQTQVDQVKSVPHSKTRKR